MPATLPTNLVDTGGDPSLELHLQELHVHRLLMQCLLQALALVLHVSYGTLQGAQYFLLYGNHTHTRLDVGEVVLCGHDGPSHELVLKGTMSLACFCERCSEGKSACRHE